MPLADNSDDFAPRPISDADRIACYLARIASALERANELASPAHEINKLQLNAIQQQLNGGIVPATILSPSSPPSHRPRRS